MGSGSAFYLLSIYIGCYSDVDDVTFRLARELAVGKHNLHLECNVYANTYSNEVCIRCVIIYMFCELET